MKTFTLELAPEVKVVAGDKEYILVIDNAAIKKWEEATGKELLGKGEIPQTATEIISLFWAAALLHQPEMTQEDVDHILHPGNLAQMTAALTELLMEVLPDAEGGEAKN